MSPEPKGCLIDEFDLDIDYLWAERGCLYPETEKGMGEGGDDDGDELD
jgi:hypothetical protein